MRGPHAFTQMGAIRYTTVGAVVPCRDVREGVPAILSVPLRRTATALAEPLEPPKPTEEDVPY